jgi:2-dehydropantoate 2-reductase
MKIIIIGAGSLGCLFGAYLALSEHQVYVYVSEKNLSNFLKNPLKFFDLQNNNKIIPKKNFIILPKTSEDSEEDPALDIEADILIISSKTYSLNSICKTYFKLIKSFNLVFLLQNGLGNEEILSKIFPNIKKIRISTSNGAMLTFQDRQPIVRHTGKGSTFLCDMENGKSSENKLIEDKLIEKFNLALQNAGISSEISSTPQEKIWRKAIINIGINPFGALTHLNNGGLLEIPELPLLIRKTVDEAILVASKLGISLEKGFNYYQLVLSVIKATSANRNSMLQDILAKRMTEIDFLNGIIVEYGKKLGIPTPFNEMITTLIHGLEHSY